MTFRDVLLQQIINGLSLGAMYSLLALGFTMVYGIIELINFAHFNIFMVGSFIAMWALQSLGLVGQSRVLLGLPLLGALSLALGVAMGLSGVIGVVIERVALRPMRNVPGTAAMITTIGVSYILFNLILLTVGAAQKNYPNPMPPVTWHLGGAALHLREVLLWTVALVLMGVLQVFVRRTCIEGAGAHRHANESACLGGVDVIERVGIRHGACGLEVHNLAAHHAVPSADGVGQLVNDAQPAGFGGRRGCGERLKGQCQKRVAG